MRIELAEPEAPRGQARPWTLEAIISKDRELSSLTIWGPGGKAHGHVSVRREDLLDFAVSIVAELRE